MAERKMQKVSEEEQKQLAMVKYRKSNRLVNAKGRPSTSVFRLFTVAVSEAKQVGNQAVAVIPGTKLRAIFQNYSGSFYDLIKRACKSPAGNGDLLSWRLEIENERTGELYYANAVSSATFKNGIFTVMFTPEISKEIIGLKSNYSEFYRGITLSMKSTFSMMLYERLSSQADYLRSTTHNEMGPYFVEYTIEDLRRTFSLDFPVTEGKKQVMRHLYPRYGDFKNGVLDIAKAEINKVSPLNVDYEPILRGRGGKTVGIKFIVNRKTNGNAKKSVVSKEEETRRKIVFADTIVLFIDKDIPAETVRRICEIAEYDYDKIKVAYDLAETQPNIENYAGWIISAIRDGYQPVKAKEKTRKKPSAKTATVKTKKTRKPKKQFSDFEQTDYDFDEIEKNLLGN